MVDAINGETPVGLKCRNKAKGSAPNLEDEPLRNMNRLLVAQPRLA